MMLYFPCYAGVEFDDSDDGLVAGDSASFGTIYTSQALTISAWVYVHTGWGSDSYPKVIEQGDYDGGGGWQMFLNGSNGYISLGVDVTNFISTTSVPVEGWHHIVVTWDHDDLVGKVYLDYTTTETAEINSDVKAIDTDVYIGNRKIFQRCFDGVIADVAVWSERLTDAEVALLYYSRLKYMPLQIQPANLVCYYPLDDQADGTASDALTFLDRSGNGNTMTADANAGDGCTARAEEYLSYP